MWRRAGRLCVFFFFFNDTATTEIYTLSLHGRSSDLVTVTNPVGAPVAGAQVIWIDARTGYTYSATTNAQGNALISPDRKSTRLNSSHANISYAVFCLKKKKHEFVGELDTAMQVQSVA